MARKMNGRLLRNQLLHPIIELFALGVIERDHLLLHELVNLFFPWRWPAAFRPDATDAMVPLVVQTFISGLGSASPPPNPMIAAS